MLIAVFIFLVVILGLLLVSLILPGKYHLEKTAIIKKSVPDVMDKIADLRHYAAWNPWQQSDPAAIGTITGIPKTIGHKYAWEGKKVGVGSLTLRDIDKKHVHFILEFIKPFRSNNGELPFPIVRLMGPFLTKNLNKQFEAGLLNLKKMCEG